MNQLEHRSGARPGDLGRARPRAMPRAQGTGPDDTSPPAPCPARTAVGERGSESMPTILVAGVVHHLEWLQALGRIQRARWNMLAPHAARAPAGLVVVGRPLAGVDAAAVIAELKDDPATAAIPVLHAAPVEAGCTACRADVCLGAGTAPGQLVRVADVLLELARVRALGPTAGGRNTSSRSERLETLGRLTSGIVHDFNNLLFVITGQIDLAGRLLGPEHPAFARLAPARQAAERAAGLTRQLLAFGRAPATRPEVVDLNAVVAQVDGMLRRVIGEDVQIEVRPGGGLGRVRADVADLEQLLLNLALNARDAMPRGGRLTIETSNVEAADGITPPVRPGRYAMLTVSDDGTGMDTETRRRIFEPFFTTKAHGAGSGLGLATVHAIVQRSGGHIRVDSDPGAGTTFRIYLPSIDEPAETPCPAAAPQALPGGHETVLVAEDSEAVREVTRELLEALGYVVLTASRGEEALTIARSHPGPIDLLLTDVVMPGLRGDSLAEQVTAARQEVRVLFMSAYADARVAGRPNGPDFVLRKPFDQQRLARAVRAALDQPRPTHG